MKKIYVYLAACVLNVSVAFAFQTPAQSNDFSHIKKLNTATTALLEKNQLNDAETTALEALQEAIKADFNEGRALALDNLGLVAQARFDYTNAMSYFVQGFKIRESVGNKSGVAVSKNRIGTIFHLQNNDAQALANLEAALPLVSVNSNDLPILAETHRNLGDVQLSKKLYGKAIQEYELALKIWAENLQDVAKAASMAAYLGKVTANIGDFDGAINNYNASLNFHRMLNEPANVANDFICLSKIYNDMKDNALALENAENARATYEQIGDKYGLAAAECQLAKVYLQNKDNVKAAEFFQKSLNILTGLSFQPSMPEVLKNVAQGYAQMGDFTQAYKAYSQYAASKDSLFSNEKSRALVEMTTRFESELNVKDKNRQLSNLEEQKATEAKLRWLLIALIGCATAAFYWALKSYKIKKKDNEKLKTLNLQIQTQNAKIGQQNDELAHKNTELSDKNNRLDTLNARLVEEVAERERSQSTLFSKDHYLADTATRMRDPLSIIVGLSQNLMTEKPRTDQREHIQNLQFAANNLLVLINDALHFSKIEAGKLSFDNIDFDLMELMETIKKDTKKVALHLQNEMPTKLHGDPTRLAQITTYLLKNLRAQTGQNETLKINLLRNDVVNNELMLKIEFITNNKFSTIERWKAVLNSPITRETGEQMTDNDSELTMVRRLVELQNGTVHAEETASGQFVISVILPYRMTENVDLNKNTEGVAIGIPHDHFLENRRILLVEDNKVNQMLVANMLRKRGATVTTANDGIESLEALERDSFDLVLMDIQMPRMDGYRAVAEIRRLKDSEKSNMPIIALTASAYINEKEKAQLFGMTDHIGKPFSPDELLNKVAQVLTTNAATHTALVTA